MEQPLNRILLVDCQKQYMDLAVLEKDSLVEYQRYRKEDASIVSNIYIGRVDNVVKGMEAVFIDIGLEKNAYMKLTKGSQYQCGQLVMVQVIKPPYKQKGAVVTTNISIPGKYAVIKPFDQGNYVSTKIVDEQERLRLKNLIKNHNSQCGFIIRTDGMNRSEEELMKDMENLEATWEQVKSVGEFRTPYTVIYRELSPLIKAVKDLLNDDVEKFIINDEEQFNIVKNYIDEYYPTYADKLQLYTDESWHLFNVYKVESALTKAMKKHVWLKSGGSIVIEQTEALVSVDVNTAKFTGKKVLEKTVLTTNLEACEAIARQIRLRNLSGIIIIDFIDMQKEEHNNKVISCLKRALRQDRIKTRVLGMTRLGLVEMTRKKVSEPLNIQMKTVE